MVFASYTLVVVEVNYASVEDEELAIAFNLKHFDSSLQR